MEINKNLIKKERTYVLPIPKKHYEYISVKKWKSRTRGYTAVCPTQQRTKKDLTLYTQEVMRETETWGTTHI